MRTDLLNLLPVEKRGKLIALVDARDASHAALLAASAALDADSAPLSRFRARESQLAALAVNAPTARERANAADVLAEHREAMAPHVAVVERRKAAKAVRESEYAESALLANIEGYLSEHRLARQHAGARAFKPVVPASIGKVSDFPAAVAETRVKIEGKTAEIERTHLAPLPVEDQIARVMADIDRRAERGAPDYDARRRDRPAIDLERSFNHPSAAADFIVWLNRSEIAERLKALIGSKDQPGALSDADREKRLAQLASEMLQLSRHEEALIVAAEAMGQRIARRRDADPRAILEVE